MAPVVQAFNFAELHELMTRGGWNGEDYVMEPVAYDPSAAIDDELPDLVGA